MIVPRELARTAGPEDRGVNPPNPWAPVPEERGAKPPRAPWKPDLVRLWCVVSALWVVQTLIRMDRVWTGGHDWDAILYRQITWCSLLLPPVAFMVLLIVVRVIAEHQERADDHRG